MSLGLSLAQCRQFLVCRFHLCEDLDGNRIFRGEVKGVSKNKTIRERVDSRI